jgi:ribosomal protein L16/L10AE
MGKGKGKLLSNWVFKVRAGYILCEIHTNFIFLAIKALKLVQYKIPLLSKLIINTNNQFLVF